jgi:hypothetical protein
MKSYGIYWMMARERNISLRLWRGRMGRFAGEYSYFCGFSSTSFRL